MGILGVHTLHEHTLAIDKELAVLDLGTVETELGGKGAFLLARGILLHHLHGVECGRVAGPGHKVGEAFKSKGESLLFLCGKECSLASLGEHQFASGREETNLVGLACSKAVPVVQGEVYEHIARCGILGQLGLDIVVAHEYLGYGHKVDIAVDTAHVPHVLTLKIRTVCPADNAHGEVVLASTDVLADIKLGIHVATLGVTHILAVYPHVGTRVDTIEVKKDALLVPTLGQGEVATIAANAVYQILLHGNVWRIIGKGIVDVNIERIAIAVHLQTSGHYHIVPLGSIHIVAIEIFLGHLHGVVEDVPYQFPCTIEAHPAIAGNGIEPGTIVALVGTHHISRLIGHVGGMTLFLVLAKHLLVLPEETLGQAVIVYLGEGEVCIGAGSVGCKIYLLVGTYGQIVVLESRRPLAAHILAHLELIGILHTLCLENFEHLVPVCRTFVHVLAPLQRLATTLESTVDTLATTLVQELKPCGSTTLIHRDAQLPHLAVSFFLFLFYNNLCIVLVASAIGQDKTRAYILNNIGKVWQRSLVVLHIDNFLQFEVGTGVAEIVLHPQITIIVFGYCLGGISCAQ